jgi:MFS family permease
LSPASFFQNSFLKDERGFSAGMVAVFTLVTSTPAVIGLIVGARVADQRGRRRLAVTCAPIGGLLIALSFSATGGLMWMTAIIGAIIAATAYPPLAVYRTELFPTGNRGRAAFLILASALIGGSISLLITGAIVDGDHIMTVLALAMKDSGQLARNTLVTTVMSNLGLKIAMRDAGIGLIETNVGDRYVLEAMREGGYSLGGEQSGHIVFSQYATTGDGVLTGLHLAAKVASSGKSLRELVAVMPNFPQVLINVPGVDKSRVDSDSELQAFVAQATAELGDRGRVLLRASGTENLVRVMVEAADQGTAQSWAERIAGLVEKRLAL